MSHSLCRPSPLGSLLLTARSCLAPVPGKSRSLIGSGAVLIALLLGLVSLAADAAPPADPFSDPAIPEPLRPWIPWVLENQPEGRQRRDCPLDSSDGKPVCAWPGRLNLDLSAEGGRFDQTWRVFAEQWVALPGDTDTWPQAVRDGAQPVPVVVRDGRPSLKLVPGTHDLSGRFVWREPPESLMLPEQTALLGLVLNGLVQPWPRLETGGRLWLRDPADAAVAAEGDQLRFEVYRRVADSLPLQVLTRLELEVSGRAREVRIGPVPLSGGIPLGVESALPTRIEADGTLRIQARPGRWELEVTAYHPGPVSTLARATAPAPWPEREVWAFAAHPDLRQIEVGGVSALDPRQTRLPEAWSRLPVYLVGPQDRMTLTEQRRGDADPEPDRLGLSRELWLDFDGLGYSVRDRISGEINRSARLEAGADLDLGQVQVDGSPRLITRLGQDGAPGVEVRQGRMDLIADGRLESTPERVPASGWALTFDETRGRLYLPPGWDLLAIAGVDNLPDTWLYRWSLLDLFLVLILTLGIGRIWGWGWGALGLAALVLTWQSPGAPQLVWLHVLAAAALLRLLPKAPAQSRLRTLVAWYWRLSLLALLVVALPFLVSEIRGGLYPHLDRSASFASLSNQTRMVTEGTSSALVGMDYHQNLLRQMDADEVSSRVSKSLKQPVSPEPNPMAALDLNAKVQTGAGIPSWRFNAYDLVWTGPVAQHEQARLWLLTPGWKLALSLCASLLVALLGLRLAGLIRAPGGSNTLALMLLAGGLATTLQPSPALAAQFPAPELLEELRTRLLEPPECLPHCLELPRLEIRAEPERLVLQLTLDATIAIAAPVPGGRGGWSPTEVSVDGETLNQLGRGADGLLLIPIPPGRHEVRLAGPMPARAEVDLPLPLPPRQVVVEADGWRVDGLDAKGRPGGQVQLVRVAERQSETDRPLTQDALPPLLLIERRLQIGIDWRVETRVLRLSPPEFPVLIPVALLPGESVQTPGVQVENDQVRVALAPGRTEMTWVSSLTPVAALDLSASTDPRLTEDWRLDVSPLWHLETEGVPPVHRRGDAERQPPSWRPLPGETLQLRFTRPMGVPGPTLTIDRMRYAVAPGRRGSDATLTLDVRSSQGGRHGIRLPDGAELRQLAVDGRALPLPAGQDVVELPLVPGKQQMMLVWRDAQVLTPAFSPALPELGINAVNLSQTVRLPDDRWVLFAAGPKVGPAVLFWGVLIVVAGLAVGLGRSRLTPLRTHDWLLLGIGLTLAEVWVVVLVVGWLFALGLRRRLDESQPAWRFNLTQIALVVLTLVALSALIEAVQQGLLGSPDMQIVGNGSSGGLLNWYQDRGGPVPPEVWVLSVPMWVYRALMLGWALWLAFRLLDWLRWGWEGFSQPRLWRERVKPPRTRRSDKTEEQPWRPA